ncbi:MAG: hypothetical protein JXO22_13380, partial [Phycisphaerae bacterium]|nr:hypothetical protein [Phycisphaerae bacterium]
MADDLYRLFRYDRKSAANAIRATFVGWRDRLSAAVVLLFALAILRSWFADRSWATAVWSAAGGSFLLGLMAGRTIATRLAFHAFDGVLAPDALRAPTRWRYAVGWQVICLAALTGLALVVQATLLPACVPMYIAGTIVGQASAALTRRGPQMPRFARAARRWLQRPFSGVVAALLLLVSLAFVERGAHHQ